MTRAFSTFTHSVVHAVQCLISGGSLPPLAASLAINLLVQPDVHARGIIAVAGITELLGEFFPRAEAGIDIERLHQVDDRGAPFQFFLLGGDRLVQDGRDIDGCGRSR